LQFHVGIIALISIFDLKYTHLYFISNILDLKSGVFLNSIQQGLIMTISPTQFVTKSNRQTGLSNGTASWTFYSRVSL